MRCTSSVHGTTVVYHDTVDDVRVCREISLLWKQYDEVVGFNYDSIMEDGIAPSDSEDERVCSDHNILD
jgi:hypothetical protein